MVDPVNTPLGRMLLEEITPVVMVFCTPLVEEACRKNGLSLVGMLSPFCNFNNIDVPVRTSSDQPYRLQKFKLRLFYASDIRQPDLEIAKERLKQVITQAGEEYFSESSSDPPQINNVLASAESEILPTWFQYFNKELVRTLSFSDHEAFDHPVACLLVVSSKDEEPINRFVDLFNTNKLPSLLNDGAMDPKILKNYLLVHDNQDDSSEKATKILTEMRSTFGPNDCQLLCINSSQDGHIEHQDNPWAHFKSDALAGGNLGCSLNSDDIDEIKDFMQELSTTRIIPYMEQKIRALNQEVSATRKGFRNQIKNLWWRKGKDDASDSGPMYTFSSIESQIRVLGDYAFMLQDYELALSSYRLISTDYKLDKAWKRYAGVQEMMGLTYFISDQSRKEAEYCMENAFNTYLKIGAHALQNATRCGLWWVEMLKSRDQYKEAATIYFRICGEDPLHAAVMLEQASYCYLLSKPPMLHKYGFHLVLSGDRYKKCDQIKHAIRTYTSAISVYKGTMWSHIKDHVHFHIGQWYAFLGMYDIAVANLLEVLACSEQSEATQELFLREFLQIVQKTGRTFEVLKLQLPVINMNSLKVIFEDQRTYASPAAANVKESFWRSLEEDIIPSLPTARSNWLDLQSKLLSKNYKESNVCVAGEAIKVDVEFINPLQISLSISSVSLICEHSIRPDEINSDTNSSGIELQNAVEDNKLSTRGETSSEVSSFTLSEVDFILGGGQTTLVQLTVTPRIEGILKVVGIRWKLSGSVVGVHNFESNIVKTKPAKGRGKARNSPANDLKFIVIKSLPRLEGFIHPLPEKAYAGDLRHLVLNLRNRSEFPVKNLKMKISHPRFLSIANEELTMKFPDCLEKKMNDEQTSGHISPNKASRNVFIFPEDISIQGEAPLVWPLWLRAAVPGNISFYVTIYYEMGDISSAMRYRTLRMHYNFQVLPSLRVSFHISPCPSRLQEFLVRMDVVNQTMAECFQVYQLSSIGHQWEISLLQTVNAMTPSQSIFAGQALSWFFMLKDRRKLAASEDEISSPLYLSSDVILGPKDDKQVLFDISRSPLADFHDHERSNQGTLSQGDSNTVDFILISQPPKSSNRSGVSNPPHLFSHHACHCSIANISPISWLVDGPRTINHDFSTSFCEIKLKMTINNTSNSVASVRINTFDSPSSSGQSSDAIAFKCNLPTVGGRLSISSPNFDALTLIGETFTMGAVRLELRCPQNVDGIAVDPEPNWNFDNLLSEINTLEKKLNASSKFPLPFIKARSPDTSHGESTVRNSRAFVMRISDNEMENMEGESEECNKSSVVAKRFNYNEIYLSEDSDDESACEAQSYLMDKVGLVEGALHELTHEHQLAVKEEIRNQILAFETDLMSEIETYSSALARVEKHREARREKDRKLDLQYQRKVAEALDNHLTAVQRDHELKSQIEERKIRSDAAYEEAKRKEKALQEEKLRQEKAKAEAEVQAKLRAEEAKRVALEAERRAAKEAAEREAANASQKVAAGASQGGTVGFQKNVTPEIVNLQSKGSGSDGPKISQSLGKMLRAAESALNLEQQRLLKLKELDETNRSLRSSSHEDFSSYERHIARLIRQIRGTKENVSAKASEIIKIFNNARCPQSISIAAFAKKVVSHCESPDNAPFACSYVIVLVTSQFPHATDFILAELYRACIYTVPKHMVYLESAFGSKEAYYKAIGYHEDDGKIESIKDCLKRVESYMKLYGALVQTEIHGVRNTHGLEEGWAWLARFLNTVPANIYTAVALNSFLQMAGFALYRKYRSQFKKILNIISENFLTALRARGDPELNPIIAEIHAYLEDNKFLQEPEGRSLQNYLLSSVMVPSESDY